MRVIVKPSTVTQLLPEIAKPFAWPVSVTFAPAAARKTIGLAEVPDVFTDTFSGYVPEETMTVCPATTLAAAAEIVQNGSAAVPEPVFEQLALPRSTYSVASAVDARAPAPTVASATSDSPAHTKTLRALR